MGVARIRVLAVVLAASAACSGPRVQEMSPALRASSVEQQEMVAAFARRLPVPLHVVNTATFELGWQTVVVLGVTAVDEAKGSFAVVGFHPAGGVKLFEVAGDRESIRRKFAQPQFLERGDFPAAVAEDTRRIYQDRFPPSDATWSRDDDAVRFRRPQGRGDLEWVFGASDGLLAEKSYFEADRRVWTVRYRDYLERAGKLYPEGIVLEHRKYGYRLILRLREIVS